LTVKENERLSRMIENFLTFSRMERNKMAFTLVDAKTRGDRQRCHRVGQDKIRRAQLSSGR